MAAATVVADLTVNGLVLDLRAIDWLALEQNPNPKQSRQGRVVKQLDDLLLRQLDDFTLKNSAILYRTFAGDLRQLDIEKLRWQTKVYATLLKGWSALRVSTSTLCW